VMGTIIRLFSGHDDLFQVFMQLAGLFGVNLMSQLMPPTMDSVPTDYFVNWIVEG